MTFPHEKGTTLCHEGDCHNFILDRVQLLKCWIAGVAWNAHGVTEVLINGRLRGFSTKSSSLKRYYFIPYFEPTLTISILNRPSICRMSIFKLFFSLEEPTVAGAHTYQDAKKSAIEYRKAKDWLRSPGGSLWGWLVSPEDRNVPGIPPDQTQ
jgi:hypothetical protein